jgi:hypothetical protein
MVYGVCPPEPLALMHPLGLSVLLAQEEDVLPGDSGSVQGASSSHCWYSQRVCRAYGFARISSTEPLSQRAACREPPLLVHAGRGEPGESQAHYGVS